MPRKLYSKFNIGLTGEELSQYPSDKHLVRLAEKIGIHSFSDFLIHLGLTKAEWEEVEYTYNQVMSSKIMALYKWRAKMSTVVSLEDLSLALQNIRYHQHHLCQIFRERPELLEVPQKVPDDDVLRELSRNVGNCIIQLGIELGLTVADIEETMYTHPKDLFEQTYDILRKWKDNSNANTLYILIRSLQRVSSQAMFFLVKNYDIKLRKTTTRKQRAEPQKATEKLVRLQGGESTSDDDSKSLERRRYEAEGAIPKQRRQQSQTWSADASGKSRSKGVDRKKEKEKSGRTAPEQFTELMEQSSSEPEQSTESIEQSGSWPEGKEKRSKKTVFAKMKKIFKLGKK